MLESEMTVGLDDRMIAQLQSQGLEQRDIDPVLPLAFAIELYRRRWLSLGLAADLVDMEREKFVLELAERNVALLDMPEESLKKELNRVKSMTGGREKT